MCCIAQIRGAFGDESRYLEFVTIAIFVAYSYPLVDSKTSDVILVLTAM